MQSCLLGKNISGGLLIATNRPYAYVLLKTKASTYCGHCFKYEGELKGKLKICAKCGLQRYCGKECQKEGWKYHIADCKLARNHGQLPQELVSLISRVLKKAKKTRCEDDGDLNWTTLDRPTTVQTHELVGESGDDTAAVSFTRSIASQYADLYGDTPKSMEEEEWRFAVIKRVLIQCKEIKSNQMETIGVGFYLSFSVLKHSCDPMAILTYDGTTAGLSALRAPRSPDEVASVSFISGIGDRKSRQKQLIDRFFLKCKCHWCTDEELDRKMHTFRCSEVGCDERLNLEDRSCSSGHKLTDSYKKTVIQDIVECKKYTEAINAMTASYPDRIEASKIFLRTSLSVDNISRLELGYALSSTEEKFTPHIARIVKLLATGIQDTYPLSMQLAAHLLLIHITTWEAEQGQQQADDTEQRKWDAMNKREMGLQQNKLAGKQLSDLYACVLPDAADITDYSSASSSEGLSDILNPPLAVPHFESQQPNGKFEEDDDASRFESMSMDGEAGEIGLSNITDIADKRVTSPTSEVADVSPAAQGPTRCPRCQYNLENFLKSQESKS